MSLKTKMFDVLADLGLNSIIAELIVTVASVIIWIFIGIILIKLMKRATYRLFKLDKRSARALTIGKLLNSIFRYIIWFIVGIVILGDLNIDVTPFIASAGVIGLAIGFGAQEIVKDFISGFFIIFEGSFDVNDVVEISGFKGNVISLGLRTTTIKNWKGEVKTVNNGDIRSLINFSKDNSVAIVEFSVAYDTDLVRLKTLMVGFEELIGTKFKGMVESPKYLGISELADSSINLMMIARTKPNEHYQVQRDMKQELIIYLNENKVEIPFPHMVIVND